MRKLMALLLALVLLLAAYPALGASVEGETEMCIRDRRQSERDGAALFQAGK